jgi:hypothetical protein
VKAKIAVEGSGTAILLVSDITGRTDIRVIRLITRRRLTGRLGETGLGLGVLTSPGVGSWVIASFVVPALAD